MLIVGACLAAPPVRADGAFPDPQQILLPPGQPRQIILATNFGLLLSEDDGGSWLFSCEQERNAYATRYLLAAQPSHRLFATASGGGLVFSDDDSCSWSAAGGSLTDVFPYSFAVDPSNAQRVYAIGVPRDDFRGGQSIYVSDDAGVTFGQPVYTAPEQSALLTVMVAPSQPGTLLATLFSAPHDHPSLLRSTDSGEHWEVVADLVDSLGENPFELLAIDPVDAKRVHVRILGASEETLALSEDGGLSFVRTASIPGMLKGFIELASGTILVGGTAGTEAVGYRSIDGGRSFEPWPNAPRVHALAERNGKLYVAADNFLDGYAIAVSDDEGEHLTPLASFSQVRAVKGCVAEACAARCAYYAGIGLWSQAVCGSDANAQSPGSTCAGGGSDSAAGGAAPEAGGPERGGRAGQPADAVAAAASNADRSAGAANLRAGGGGCACSFAPTAPSYRWMPLFAWALAATRVLRRRAAPTRA